MSPTGPTAEEAREGRWAVIEPRDTVHVRDGRAFDAGEDSTAYTVRPWPSTVAGALAKALGGEPSCVRGPVLVHQPKPDKREVFFPVPADLVTSSQAGRSEVWRLSVPDRAPEGVVTDLDEQAPQAKGARVPSYARRSEPLTGWVPATVLSSYLAGTLFGSRRSTSTADIRLRDPVLFETRVGLGRDADTRTAEDGKLYRTSHIRLQDRWQFAAQYVPARDDEPPPRGPVPFGGRGRLAEICLDEQLAWPPVPDEFPNGQMLLYVVTPGIWARGWIPPLDPGTVLVGACVPEPVVVSTASPNDTYREFLASRASYWAVPAGSVYYLKFPSPETALVWARTWHNHALEPARPRLDTAGFGVVLTGVWP
ncbi:CRISPR-associated protein Cmr3 [Nocardiopsis sp. Huas11]|uniref:type III-B CRISPR module-associated Cmr3 family protein n=1 Tax=Nocardiopsis sp. Huas11 TaxID=2183912 RepID=UPI000EAC32EB|nr:type III-B CRISPR module-associated Cmr3 family protein [Nocardiopsis sp. Huas11]RKS07008.1 CRISPR-associated protein Cmr3 [Nocardiopsis sp. Huas11]